MVTESRYGLRAGRHQTIILLLGLYVCWGTAIPAMKLMVDSIPPLGGASLIFLLAGIVFAISSRNRPRPTPRQIRQLAIAGVLLLVGGQGLAMIALTAVTASVGAILAAAIPLWVIVLGALTGTPCSRMSVIRLVGGFGGIAIVIFTAPGSAIGGEPWAVAVFCAAPALWAAGSLLTARTEQPIDLMAASAIQLLSGGGCLLLIALLRGEFTPVHWASVHLMSGGAAIYLLIFDSLVGFLLYTRLLKSAPPTLVNSYAYVTPIVGIAVGAILLDEPLWAGAFVGGALVIGAIALELRGKEA